MVLGARHGDIEQPPFFLDLGARSGGEVGRQAAVDRVQHEDRLPLLPFRRMDGGEDEVILVEQRQRRTRRWWRPAGRASARSGSVRGSDRSQAICSVARIGLAQLRVFMDAFEMRFVPARARDRDPPASRPPRLRTGERPRGRRGQCSAARGWRLDIAQRRDRIGASAMRSSTCAPRSGRCPGINCMTRKPATRSRGFSVQRSNESTSLMCADSRNFNPPNFTNGMLRRVSSISSGALWCEARNSTACAFQRDAPARASPAPARRRSAPDRPRRAR